MILPGTIDCLTPHRIKLAYTRNPICWLQLTDKFLFQFWFDVSQKSIAITVQCVLLSKSLAKLITTTVGTRYSEMHCSKLPMSSPVEMLLVCPLELVSIENWQTATMHLRYFHDEKKTTCTNIEHSEIDLS